MSPDRRPSGRPLAHDLRIFLMTLAAGLPAVALAMALLWSGAHESKTRWTLATLMVMAWVGTALAVRERVVRPLQTLSNMLAALREGDFSIRARHASQDDALGLAFWEINTMTATLREQRLGALEATALLQRVMAEIDVAVFAFDGSRRLRLVNRAGERLLRRPAEYLLGRDAEALGLGDALGAADLPDAESARVIELSLPGGRGRWEARHSEFRQGGLPHRLLVLSDLSRTLREEERQAWQRLVRVLSHEINNSLAPIKSIAESLQSQVSRAPRPESLDGDLRSGLGIIAGRAESLSRFMAAYARLARLPRPKTAPMDVGSWVRRVAGLETRLLVEVVPGPPLTIEADADQLEQLLINLVRNGADAALETRGGVRVGWAVEDGAVEVWVEDDGPGLASSDNLFVPFFTTKPTGSGVGLPLSRQIAEGHGGTVTLENRSGARGGIARLRLPRVASV